MKINAYIYHKRAEKYSDCQDYFEIDSQNNRIAVADGMSQSIYPQWWAKILVKAYLVEGRVPKPEDLQKYQDVWQDEVQKEIAKRENAGINPWRLKNAFAEKSGAGATLCGFTWNKQGWSCEIIGDSSLIIINKDYTIKILSSQEGEFGNHPDYLDSFHNGRGSVKTFNDSFKKDVLAILLVTDPFSELFQKHITDKEFIKTCFQEFLALSDHKSYCELVERWRDNLNMHNDDSTLIILNDFSAVKSILVHIDSLDNLCSDETTAKAAKENQYQSKETVNIKKVYEKPEKAADKGCVTEIFQSTRFTLTEEEKNEAENEFRCAFERVLCFFNGKRSKRKVNKFINKILHPIIKEYCKK